MWTRATTDGLLYTWFGIFRFHKRGEIIRDKMQNIFHKGKSSANLYFSYKIFIGTCRELNLNSQIPHAFSHRPWCEYTGSNFCLRGDDRSMSPHCRCALFMGCAALATQ
jgi:hypothetical protein